MLPSTPPTSRSALLVLLVAGASALPSLGAPARVTLDDVVALLKAHVGESLILKEIGSDAPPFALGVPEIVRLKEAGASDALLERLMGDDAPAAVREQAPSAAPERGAGYRIYREKAPDGQEILHVTNIDPQGHRMGGDVPDSPSVPNRYDAPPPASPAADHEYVVIGDQPPSPPVVVNVYPGGDGGAYAAGYGSPYMYRDPYAYTYPRGILPGYHPYFGIYRSPGTIAPPGSVTHFQRYHADGWGASGSRLGPPWTAIGPAIGYDMYYRHTQAGYPR